MAKKPNKNTEKTGQFYQSKWQRSSWKTNGLMGGKSNGNSLKSKEFIRLISWRHDK